MSTPAPSSRPRARARRESRSRASRPIALALLIALAGPAPSLLAAPKPLALRHVAIDLPGAPAEILHADLDEDGRQDLAIVVARTAWGEIGMDRIEGMVQISEVVPALFDRREVRAYRLGEDGTYRETGEPLTLPTSVISLEGGPPGLPIAVLTDDGVSALSLIRDDAAESGGDAAPADGSKGMAGVVSGGSSSAPSIDVPFLTLTPWIADRPVLAGSKSLVPRLQMVRDLDGDGSTDFLLPARDGVAAYMTTGGELATRAASRITLPGDTRRSGTAPMRRYPRPAVGDLDGDAKPDLYVTHSEKGVTVHEILRGEGGGRFGAPQRIALEKFLEPSAGAGKDGKSSGGGHFGDGDTANDVELGYLGDLDGDGLAEVVFATEIDTGKSELKQAKEPEFDYRFHHLGKDLVVQPTPYHTLRVRGFGFSFDVGELVAEEFTDLDGDGRKDLVTVTLDFSLLQLVRVMTTKRIGIGLDFHVWHQEADGRFTPVTGLDLSETVRMDLNNLKLGRLAQFAGDFDGDGRSDFIHLGRGKDVTIHRGQAGCRYAPKADLTVSLEEEPADISFVRIGDFDGDGRSDLGLIRLLDQGDAKDPDVTSPVRLDLYLSRGAR